MVGFVHPTGAIVQAENAKLPPSSAPGRRVTQVPPTSVGVSAVGLGFRVHGSPFSWAGQDRHWEELISTEPRINERIHVNEVRLVGPNGEQVGIVRIDDALRLAREADLDLVEVAPQARPPVAKLMDYGKYKYEAAQKARESRRNQSNTVLKEMKLRPKIDEHDYETKKGHVVRFLKAGDKVKITIMFRGREQSRPELGFNLLRRLADDIAEDGFIESQPRQDGRNMLMVVAPTRKKSEARAEQRAAKATRDASRAAENEAEERELAELRSARQSQPKKRRGPADNMDPDIDL